ncbi:hypothetical protein Syun_018090 [Stephania yunnanensis]|uniref:Receptor-like serine/threonine-protein kinase n=1 Tax=Stephania yunnanensis TaxID=152371 RepID=A0AAP0NVG9_9MAGN
MAGMQNLVWHLKFSLACFVVACISCIASLTHAGSDMIAKNQHLSDGQTLVSAEGNFVLGFFSPPNSTNRYVGIWYGRVSLKTVVWVANRGRPLTDSNGELALNGDGSLVIVDRGSGYIVVSYGSASNANTTAKLLDNGNFILSEGNDGSSGRILWQSFENPTDTILPGMKLGLNLKTKQNHVLTSWRSEEDPSPGVYSFGANPNSTTQFFIWQDETIYWKTEIFSKNTLLPQLEINTANLQLRFKHLFNYSYITNEDEQYFTYSLYYHDVISRLVLDSYGKIKQYEWSEELEKWNILWTFPRDICDVYAPCGVNGICDANSSIPCKCSQGFEPVSPRKWESGDWSDGCQRRVKLKCGDEVGFLQLRNLEVPYLTPFQDGWGSDIKQCEAACRQDCLCTAYVSANESKCLFWYNDMFYLQENYSGVHVDEDVFIKVAALELDGHKKKRKALTVVAVMLPLLVFSLFIFYFWRRKKMEIAKRKELLQLELPTEIIATSEFNSINAFRKHQHGSDMQLFSFSTIAAATNNFSMANKLGEGGFGPVYMGKLYQGQEIAVKRLSRTSKQGLVEFTNEIKLIAKLQHKNLVRLLGCSIHGEEKMLIYEYMPNNSLDSFLFDVGKQRILDWGRRVSIIEGIARGLLYLHNYSRLRVIHRDLKASNILLDGEMNPKISDFGMARIFGLNESVACTGRIAGTRGYMSPEYAMKGLFSEKSDVFSFGVLLLEIITGERSTSFNRLDCSLNFLGYAWEMWKNDNVELLMDPALKDSTSAHSIKRYIQVALLCVQESAVDRPTMLGVMSMLRNEAATLLNPRQPAFSYLSKEVEDNLPKKNSHGGCSANIVTISDLEPR